MYRKSTLNEETFPFGVDFRCKGTKIFSNTQIKMHKNAEKRK